MVASLGMDLCVSNRHALSHTDVVHKSSKRSWQLRIWDDDDNNNEQEPQKLQQHTNAANTQGTKKIFGDNAGFISYSCL